MNNAEFTKKLSTIKRHSEGLANDVHSCAMFSLEQVNIHGNTDPMNRMLGVLHQSQRKQALVVWFEDLSKGVLQKDKTFKYSKGKAITVLDQGEKVEYTPEDAIVFGDANPYYDYTHEVKPPSSFDVLKAVESMLKKIERYTMEGKQVNHYELKEKLAALIEG